MTEEHIYLMALSRICNFSFQTALSLYKALGSARAVYDHRSDVGEVLGGCHPRLVEALADWSEPLARAEQEALFVERHAIRVLSPADEGYPARLLECSDAPLTLYYKGNANLNASKVIAVVGTRHCTTYGADLIRRFCEDLRSLLPHVLIVSGLAYGVDIQAHRQALANGFETVGVLAHGLDRLYPSAHRATAKEMLEQGGLLTEFMSETNADKPNFVRRNRIVAGMADATLLVESAEKGGGLITASIAQSYQRDVFAFPGAVGAPYSVGCNNLIRDNAAMLVTSALDLVKAMRWEEEAMQRKSGKSVERSLFPDLSAEEQSVLELLQQENDLPLNIIAVRTSMPVHQVTALLFQMEMKGLVKPYAGGVYHLYV